MQAVRKAMKPSIEHSFQIRNLTKVYGEGATAVHALRGVDLDVVSGEMVVMLGASGSGKSTIARLLSRLYKPWSGSIEIGGIDIDKIDPKDFSKIIAFVDQKIVLFNASISENLSKTIVSLPMHPYLDYRDIELITQIIKNPLFYILFIFYSFLHHNCCIFIIKICNFDYIIKFKQICTLKSYTSCFFFCIKVDVYIYSSNF